MAIVLFAFSSVYLSKQLLEKFDLEIQVKVTEYNIRNGSIRWQVSTTIKSYLSIFRQLSPFSRFITFSKIMTLQIQVMVMTTFAATFDGKIPDYLSKSNSNVCSVSHRFTRYSQIKNNSKSITLKMKVQVKKQNNGTCANRLEMFESIQVNLYRNLATVQRTFT